MTTVYSQLVSPFRYQAGNTGCLLLHGLTGSPFEVRELGEFLYAEGITVSGPLLTGHATNDWRDLAQAKWHDWAAVAETEYRYLATRCDKVVIAGLSMGGSLGLWLAACSLASPVALIVMAAPVSLLNPLQRMLIRLLGRIIPYRSKHESSICDAAARVSHMTGKHTVYAAIASGDEFLAQLRLRIAQVRTPTLLIYSEKDSVVKPANGTYVYSHLGSDTKKLIWLHNSFHIITRDYDKQIVFDEVLSCMRRVRDGLIPVL